MQMQCSCRSRECKAPSLYGGLFGNPTGIMVCGDAAQQISVVYSGPKRWAERGIGVVGDADLTTPRLSEVRRGQGRA